MTLPVVYRREVGRDLAGAYGWYEEQRAGLEEEFITAVDASFDAIERFPEAFRRVHGEVRRANVARFPYAVFYRMDPQYVLILESSTRLAIQRSGHGQEVEPANRRIDTDRFAADHAGRWAS